MDVNSRGLEGIIDTEIEDLLWYPAVMRNPLFCMLGHANVLASKIYKWLRLFRTFEEGQTQRGVDSFVGRKT